MKISIFLTNAIATTVLFTFLPYHESDALSFEGIKNKTTGKIIFGSNTRVFQSRRLRCAEAQYVDRFHFYINI